jgi:hypothetical protein
MSCRNLGAFVIAVFPFMAVAACSRESPVAPNALPIGVSSQSTAATQPVDAGTYEILFLKSTRQGLEPVLNFTLNVREYLVLKSQIRDNLGVLAEDGVVTYEYCARQKVKVRSSECDSGQATWTRLISMPVDPVGSLAGFGSCSTPRTIGFRVRFNGQGGRIASGMSASQDVSWE